MKNWIKVSLVAVGIVGGCKFSSPTDVPATDAAVDAPVPMVGLTVTVAGEGVVASDPAGIVCGADCTNDFPVGGMVTLTAEPAVGWEVTGWVGTGASCGVGARTCVVTMNQARSVTVTFERGYALMVDVTGSGMGTVTGGGINCATGNIGTCAVRAVVASRSTTT